jgi:hypothetical protein
MKTALFGTLIFTSLSASAFEKTCQVTKIFDSGFLEESLGEEKDSEVRIFSAEVLIGSSKFSLEKGDEIKEAASLGAEKNIEVIQGGGEVKYFINIANLPTNKSGTLTGQIKGESASKIADLECK